MRIDVRALVQKALLGGLGGLIGWGLISLVDPVGGGVYLTDAVTGALVGLALGASCGSWDGLFRSRSARRLLRGAGLGAGLGLVGGLLGLVIGEAIFGLAGGGLAPRAVGWAVFGAFIGAGEGLARRTRLTALYWSYGGFLGGLIGGSCYEWLFGVLRALLPRVAPAALDPREAALAVSGAAGLTLLGLCIGAMMGLVEDLLRSAWLVFLNGRLEGQTRTLDPSRKVIRLGRSDSADVCILGDPQLAGQHARLVAAAGGFAIEAADGPVLVGRGGPPVPVSRHTLRGGDVLQLGQTRFRFQQGGTP
jgi:hypothetical protein